MKPLLPPAIVRIAKKEVGVFEIPKDSNCGPRVNQYKAATWLNPYQSWPWCAAFVDWVVAQAMIETGTHETATFRRPRTAGAWDLLRWSRAQDNSTRTQEPATDLAPGDVIVFNFSHCGIVISPVGSGKIQTVEGNTDEAGSREGGGVYLKIRDLSQIKGRIRFTL